MRELLLVVLLTLCEATPALAATQEEGSSDWLNTTIPLTWLITIVVGGIGSYFSLLYSFKSYQTTNNAAVQTLKDEAFKQAAKIETQKKEMEHLEREVYARMERTAEKMEHTVQSLIKFTTMLEQWHQSNQAMFSDIKKKHAEQDTSTQQFWKDYGGILSDLKKK